ncbi:P-loop ATPase, Sll1717 family [uncultured Roseobacter sp.]|uniref:P-loop ATPase, Sll1717 family n=1 Tax=uncultured Roseobacter sp. TaxID=114847 RepID=UPI002625B43D|nr:hypothetical protein [uncultured Roseobacter sp.]
MARDIGCTEAQLTQWLNGELQLRQGSLEKIALFVFSDLKKRRNEPAYNQAEGEFIEAHAFLKRCAKGEVTVDGSPPKRVRQFLIESGILSSDGTLKQDAIGLDYEKTANLNQSKSSDARQTVTDKVWNSQKQNAHLVPSGESREESGIPEKLSTHHSGRQGSFVSAPQTPNKKDDEIDSLDNNELPKIIRKNTDLEAASIDSEIDPISVGPYYPTSSKLFDRDDLYRAKPIPLSEPFGPIDAHDLIDEYGNLNNAYAISNAVKSALTRYGARGNLHIGRKGTGKTTLLHMSKSRRGISVKINIGAEFGSMVSLLEDHRRTSFAETAGRVWSTVIWNSIAIVVYRHLHAGLSELDASQAELIEGYVGSLREILNRKLRSKIRSGTKVDVLDYLGGNSIDFAATMIEAAYDSDIEIDAVKSALFSLLDRSNRNVVVLIDTMEFYKVEMSKIARACLQGLVTSSAKIHRGRYPVHCKLFFPGELVHLYKTEISHSVHKDFRDAQFLEWRSNELVTLAAYRFRDRLSDLSGMPNWQLAEISEEDVSTSQSLFHRFLPASVTNDRGARSEVVSYILRHTQMTPRQLLIVLNRLGELYFEVSGHEVRHRKQKISEAEIHSVINRTSFEIYNELFRSFSGIYPPIEKLMMKVLPRLKRVFSDDELYEVYISQEIAQTFRMDFEELKYAFADIGAVGLVDLQKSNSNSAYGLFSYMSDERLILSASREYCVHPIFSAVHHPQSSQYMTVYPAGASILLN